MNSDLLGWLTQPRAGVGVRFAQSDGWSVHPYTTLAARARAVGSALVDAGVAAGDRVCLLIQNSEHFVTALFGALAMGATPSPLPPPYTFQDIHRYVAHLAAMLHVAKPSVICTSEMLAVLAENAVKQAALPVRVVIASQLTGDPSFEPRPPAELGLLQFTSGSTGTPRGVALELPHVQANLQAIANWLQMTPDSRTATWLPFSHDMGLIGTLLTPIATQSALSVLSPEQFVTQSLRWLECFGRDGADLTASPTFGFALALRRVKPAQLEGMDFSRWRVIIVGAERVRADVLDEFARLLEPHGFSRAAYRPAYGLAEATLAVTGHPGGPVADMIKVSWSQMRDGEPVEVEARRPLGSVALGEASDWLVGCGRPLDGVDVRVVDQRDGAPLPDGSLGEIVVRGPSIARGYWTAEGADEGPLSGGRFVTGDAGLVLDGQLYVIGRIGDCIKVRARQLYAETLEARLVAATSLRDGRFAVMLGSLEGADSAVVLVEQPRGAWEDEVLRVVQHATGESLRIRLLHTERGNIERTTSGKPRRRVMWQKLQHGRLPASVVAEWAPP